MEFEKKRYEDKNYYSKFMNTISIVFNSAFIINCIILAFNNNNNIGNIIVYIQYSCLMRNSVSSCISIYNQFI